MRIKIKIALWDALPWLLTIAWIAIWVKLKRIADELYVIRQHIENTEGRDANVASSESVGEESEG